MGNDSKLPRAFGWLNATQFFGALNDNLFKFLVVFFVVGLLGEKHKPAVIATASVMFVLPFILFSHAAGVLADRYSKRTIIVCAKALEVLVMLIAMGGLYLGAPGFLYVLIFLMCTVAAVFGPCKYGIVPELVASEKLSKANGYLSALSYLAIIIGTFLPTCFLDALFPGNYYVLLGACIVIAVAGVLTSIPISRTPAVGNHREFSLLFVVDVLKTLRGLKTDRHLLLTMIALGYFLFLAGFFQQNLLLYGSEYLGMDFAKSGYLFPVVALGIGLGAVSAGRLSGRNIEIGIVPIGAVGLTLCCIVLHFIPPSIAATLVVVLLAGISAGLFVVPMDAFVQYRSPPERLGEIIACVNFVGFLGVAASSGMLLLLTSVAGLPPEQCFLVVGILTGVLALAAVIILPDFLVRFIGVVITRLIYRVKINGEENIPLKGPALLVSNHVTWVDALLLMATQQRRIRFVMDSNVYRTPWLRPIFKLMGSIPVTASEAELERPDAYTKARRALDEGFLVCVFAEREMTRNGNMFGFRIKCQDIVGKREIPVIPVYIGNAWGSSFSYCGGRPSARLLSRIPYPIYIIVGQRMKPSPSSDELRLAVQELSSEVFFLKKSPKRTLPAMFIRTARRAWFRTALGDGSGRVLSYGRTLASAIALGRELNRMTRNQDKVGVIMPASIGGVLVNLALTILGKVAVNLNFTSSATALQSAMRQCQISTIVSSRAFLDKLENLPSPDGMVFLEDILPRLGTGPMIKALFLAAFAPIHILALHRVGGPDDLATVIFSSGSTAEPKGIMLSHHNIVSNIEAFREVLWLGASDRMCAVLPFFHSFGYTVTLWCPLIAGFSAFFHPNPLDGTAIAGMVRRHKLTILLSTPTFLLSYIRRAQPEDFSSLRAVIAGAEKLKERVADAFHERFGVRPLEGYGATELSPVAAVNIPDVEVDGVRQVGTKNGSVGHPVPGVAMKVVEMDSGLALPADQQGVLLVKGPNVMMGYLNNPVKTAEVISGGWYHTGDLARIDADGFVYLLDRLSRYSKIGGEMVPHVAVEERYLQELKTMNQAVFVSAAPDDKRGEQLVVFFTPEAGDAVTLHQMIAKADIPNLWKPKKENYVPLTSIPTLGSGKLDMKSLKDMAREFTTNRPLTIHGVIEQVLNKV